MAVSVCVLPQSALKTKTTAPGRLPAPAGLAQIKSHSSTAAVLLAILPHRLLPSFSFGISRTVDQRTFTDLLCIYLQQKCCEVGSLTSFFTSFHAPLRRGILVHTQKKTLQ